MATEGMSMTGTLAVLPRGGVRDDGSAKAAEDASMAASNLGLHGEACHWAYVAGHRAALEGATLEGWA